MDFHTEKEVFRGRTEVRKTFLYKSQGNLHEDWQNVGSIILVRRYFRFKAKEYESESLYISDLQGFRAKFIAKDFHSHWSIENKLHYTKDVVMREDKECTRHKNAAANLALFRDFAFNILKTKDKSVKYACEIFANYTIKELFKTLLRT